MWHELASETDKDSLLVTISFYAFEVVKIAWSFETSPLYKFDIKIPIMAHSLRVASHKLALFKIRHNSHTS